MFERFSGAARYAIVIAQEEARELRSPTVGVEHLLLGLTVGPDIPLRAVLSEHGITTESIRTALQRHQSGDPLGEEDAAALRSIGIDLDAVRESVRAGFGPDALERAVPERGGRSRGRFGRGGGMNFGHIPFTQQAKKVLEGALREAVGRHDDRLEAGHLLLGILRLPNAQTLALLGDADNVDQLGQGIRDLLDRAA